MIRVVELGSIQRTALALGISRSSLRRRLDGLEAEIGSELFVRSAAGVALTPAGAIVLEEGRMILEHCARMVSSAKSTKEDVSGKILLVLPLGVPDNLRVGLLRGLQAIAPRVCVEEVERADPLDHLHEPFDLMFHFGEPPERGDWFSRVITRVRLVPIASQAYLDEFGRPSSPAALAGHRLLGWKLPKTNPREWPLWSGGEIPVEPIFCSRNGQLLHFMVQQNIGILLGDPNTALLHHPIPLVPVLDKEIGRELTLRCLSPLPGSADPRSRAVLDSVRALSIAMSQED